MIGVSDGFSFLIGVGVGASGTYFADKYTDQRRRQDQNREENRRFREAAREMPTLIGEMAVDVRRANSEYVRNLVLLPSKAVSFNGDDAFQYYEEEHPNLRGQFAILENHGYIVDVTSGNVPIFRASEEFVQHLRGFRKRDLARG